MREKKPLMGALTLRAAPYRVKMKLLKTLGLWYAKEQAWAYGFNAKTIIRNNPDIGYNVTVAIFCLYVCPLKLEVF